MRVTVIGKLESATLNGVGNIHLIISKEKTDLVSSLCTVIRQLEGKEVILVIKERSN